MGLQEYTTRFDRRETVFPLTRPPTEACYLPDTPVQVTSVGDYRKELMLSLTSARDLAAQFIQKAQEQYKGIMISV